MSDCFDHMTDAYESYDRAFDEGFRFGRRSRVSQFTPDPDFYHTRIEFMCIEAETHKALLLRLGKKVGVWVPKSICRKLKERSVWVHTDTYRKLTRVSLTLESKEK